jgi:bifunctional NMN adenylyltransferase/nudix hydrolase
MWKMSKLGVIIGRFQVPELHLGHRALISEVFHRSDTVVIFVGVAPFKYTKRNPLEHFEVADSIRSYIDNTFDKSESDNVFVIPLLDRKTDEEWTANVDAILDNLGAGAEVTLYTDRDGFQDHYKGKYPVEVLDLGITTSATEVRAAIEPINSADFRAGVIYGIEKQYPVARVAVDVIMMNTSQHNYLLVRKIGEDKFRFPGGMVDITDQSLEHTVRRELMEECPTSWIGEPTYQFSTAVGDWRGQVLSTVFVVSCEGFNPDVTGNDEIAERKLFELGKVANVLVPEHKPIWERFLGHL